MRYHLFKTSPTRNLIITVSYERNLTIPIFNILVLRGAQAEDVRPFLPAKSQRSVRSDRALRRRQRLTNR